VYRFFIVPDLVSYRVWVSEKASVLAEAFGWVWLRLFCGLGGIGLGELAAEALDASGGVYQLLLAGEKWVAVGADFEMQVAFVRGAGLKVISAGAPDFDGLVLRVDSLFGHGLFSFG